MSRGLPNTTGCGHGITRPPPTHLAPTIFNLANGLLAADLSTMEPCESVRANPLCGQGVPLVPLMPEGSPPPTPCCRNSRFALCCLWAGRSAVVELAAPLARLAHVAAGRAPRGESDLGQATILAFCPLEEQFQRIRKPRLTSSTFNPFEHNIRLRRSKCVALLP